jgi:dodecin
VTVVKVIELIGSSPNSWDEAVKNALAEAAMTVQNIKAIYVKNVQAQVEDNKIVEYKANVKISFIVERKQ